MIANHCNVAFKDWEDDKMSTADGLARSAFYGFTYVPFATLNGFGSSANSINSSSINSEFNKTEYFSFSVKSIKTSDSPKTCSTTITIDCIENYRGSNDLVLMTAVIENNVDYLGTYGIAAKNGKNNYNHVLRKYISPIDGSKISVKSNGSSESFTFTYENDESYNDYENLRIVAFIQDRTTKEILGAYQTTSHPFQESTSIYNNKIANISTVAFHPNSGLSIKSIHEGNVSIDIKKLNGQIISRFKQRVSAGQQNIAINTNTLSKGVYLLSLNGIISINTKIIIP